MSTLDVRSRSGDVLHDKQLADAFTDAEVNGPVIHQCVVAYLANQRQGSASTKSRSDVRGSGRKLYRQKGTGRARVGHAKAPNRVHGGVAFGAQTTQLPAVYPKTGPGGLDFIAHSQTGSRISSAFLLKILRLSNHARKT